MKIIIFILAAFNSCFQAITCEAATVNLLDEPYELQLSDTWIFDFDFGHGFSSINSAELTFTGISQKGIFERCLELECEAITEPPRLIASILGTQYGWSNRVEFAFADGSFIFTVDLLDELGIYRLASLEPLFDGFGEIGFYLNKRVCIPTLDCGYNVEPSLILSNISLSIDGVTNVPILGGVWLFISSLGAIRLVKQFEH